MASTGRKWNLRGMARPRTIAPLLALILALAGLAAAWPEQAARSARTGKDLTVERIYGQPSLSGSLTTGLEWSPDGKLLGYFQRFGEGEQAKTDLWVLDVGSGERRLLVDSEKLKQLLAPAAGTQGQQTGLGRITPPQYFWAPGGDALLFVSQTDLYWFDLKTQAGKKLTAARGSEAGSAPTPTRGAGHSPAVAALFAIKDPKISPDGRWVSFVRNYNLWVVEVATGQERPLTFGGREDLRCGQLDWVYPEELDLHTAYWWSPDSTQISYLLLDERRVTRYPLVDHLSYTGETEMMRYPKAGDANPVVRVGVVAVADSSSPPRRINPTRWMDTGRDTDIYIARVAWLPDSKRLAIQRLNRAQNRLELLFANAADGRSQIVLTEEDKYWVNLHDDLYFFAGGRRLLWSSERDAPGGKGEGFRHLYLYELDPDTGGLKGSPKQLTRGSWAVVRLAGVNEKDGAVFFIGTEKSPLERHLYRVGIDGAGIERLSREDGTHTIRMAPDATHYLDTYSNISAPSRQDVYRADGTRQLAVNDNKVAELESYRLQPVEFLAAPGADGTPLHAMMIKPPGFTASRKYPVLVNLYGGPHGQVVRNAWGGTSFLWHQMMAQKGYVVFSVDNRGMAARGHAFESPIYRKMGQEELADQLAAVRYLKSLRYVDGARIGIWGWSYGGYMTCYAMLDAPDVFKAGFAGAPVTDWRQYDTIYTERYMGLPKDNAEGYKQSSPVTHAAKLKGKLLIAHGTGDDNVHFANTLELSEQFIKAGRYAEIHFYPGRGHGISDPTARLHLFKRVTQFFLDNL